MRLAMLRFVLLSLLLLSAVVTLQKLVAVRAPMPEREAPASLQLAGFRLARLDSLPAKPGRDFSRGQGRRFRLESNSNPALLVTVLPVRARRQATLSMVQVAAMEPSFALKKPRLLRIPRLSKTDKRPPEELLFGQARPPQGQPLDVLRMQTCLVLSGAAVVSAQTLHYEVERLLRDQLKQSPLQAMLSRYLGPQTNNNRECLALQLQTDSGPAAEQLLLSAWTPLREQLAD
jgi:hypothetical protein